MVAKTREEKLNAISAKVDGSKLSDEQIDLLYDQLEVLYKHFDKNKQKPQTKDNKKPKEVKKKRINKGSDRYKLTLEFTNKILSSLNRPKLTDLTAGLFTQQ